ncbi:hypothetical protein K4A07_16600, partial [Lactiplantibacillus plantarum]|nr:hypothetical protein [Lactiplantibacillus plantarum]
MKPQRPWGFDGRPRSPPQVGSPTIQTASLTPPPLDPRGHVRKELMEQAMTSLVTHHRHLPMRDRMYLVEFQKF